VTLKSTNKLLLAGPNDESLEFVPPTEGWAARPHSLYRSSVRRVKSGYARPTDPTANEAISRVIAGLNGTKLDPEPRFAVCDRCGLSGHWRQPHPDVKPPQPDVRFVERDGAWFHGHRPLPKPPEWLQADWAELQRKRRELIKELRKFTVSHGPTVTKKWLEGRVVYSQQIAWINTVIGVDWLDEGWRNWKAHHRLGHPPPCGGRWRFIRFPEAPKTNQVLEHLAGYAQRNGFMTLGAGA
jgi:hypothetical protein